MSEMIRIGGKVLSRDKLYGAIDQLLLDRSKGATQAEAARVAGVSRSFVSNLESLGEVRYGARVALVAFPVSNGDELRKLVEEFSLDFALIFSQDERSRAESGNAGDMLNQLLDTLVELNNYSAVIVLASDWRVQTMKRLLDSDVIGIELGASPLHNDVEVDIDHLRSILTGVIEGAQDEQQPSRGGRMSERGQRVRKAWDQLKRQ
ncbi:MAG: transcriptional regulator [Coriobacteriia bacterium]|nr:transcriptional regulator [Coriobacteriia bacterium]MCL2870337.1 transcriptional regulator [Coriobacteriia bacterium]